MMDQFLRLRKYYSGDFYPLTRCTTSNRDWMAYQMHRPDLEEGIVVAYRRRDSKLTEARFLLSGLENSADYYMEDIDSETSEVYSGETLMQKGICIEIPELPGSRIFIYGKINDRS